MINGVLPESADVATARVGDWATGRAGVAACGRGFGFLGRFDVVPDAVLPDPLVLALEGSDVDRSDDVELPFVGDVPEDGAGVVAGGSGLDVGAGVEVGFGFGAGVLGFLVGGFETVGSGFATGAGSGSGPAA